MVQIFAPGVIELLVGALKMGTERRPLSQDATVQS